MFCSSFSRSAHYSRFPSLPIPGPKIVIVDESVIVLESYTVFTSEFHIVGGEYTTQVQKQIFQIVPPFLFIFLPFHRGSDFSLQILQETH